VHDEARGTVAGAAMRRCSSLQLAAVTVRITSIALVINSDIAHCTHW